DGLDAVNIGSSRVSVSGLVGVDLSSSYVNRQYNLRVQHFERYGNFVVRTINRNRHVILSTSKRLFILRIICIVVESSAGQRNLNLTSCIVQRKVKIQLGAAIQSIAQCRSCSAVQRDIASGYNSTPRREGAHNISFLIDRSNIRAVAHLVAGVNNQQFQIAV